LRTTLQNEKRGRKLTKAELLKIFEEAINFNLFKALQGHIIRSSWKTTGLFPWSPKTIRDLLFQNVGFSAKSIRQSGDTG